MRVAVVGGGIVGLFTAWYLEREGSEVTVFEEGPLGAGSVHAAGIIEPATAYRTNTFSFLRRVWRFVKSGTCTFRGVDPRWLVESAHQLERSPPAGAEEAMRELSTTSVAAYQGFARAGNDFDYGEGGLLERFDDRTHFAEERELALAQQDEVPVEVRPADGAGALYFPKVSWLHTERFVDRLARDLPRTRVVRARVRRVQLDGTVVVGSEATRYDAVVACAGVACRRLGVPLTGVRGYGWHVRARGTADLATIFVDRGIAVVPLSDGTKVTGGWDFDLSRSPAHARAVLAAVRRVVSIDAVLDFKDGSRPCTPDGLPTVGRRERLVVASGGFRLGWSFAPGLGRRAALLALGRAEPDPFLARYCGALRSGNLR
jgi:D-proline dehydrogenase